ncbi:MAG: hypothetical protein DMF85_07310, partial [Acidobacteria bacterium]
ATFVAPATIGLSASAGDSDGTVSKVDFYAGATLLGTSTSSPYGVTWNNVAAGTYNLTAVATDNGGATTTSAAVSVTVGNPSNGLPSPWTQVGIAGDATYSNPTFTVTGAGADVWGTADAFHYVYQPLNGDGSIVARVATVQNTTSWAKAGVMIRNTLDPGSAQAFMLVSWAKGVAFQRRTLDGGTSVSTPGTMSTAPRWVKLTRTGSTIAAFESSDGVTWTQVASDTFSSMGTTLFVGLAVSSHVSGVNCTATFDNVTLTPSNLPPSASLTAPANGATFTAPASITLTATASDSDGTIAKVDFYAGATQLGTATASPYAFTWSNVAAGTYNLKAVATDNLGATGSSAVVSVTVNPPNVPPSVALTSPANGATFIGPATITITANASDSDGTVATVDFFAGTTLLGTATASPYGLTWSNVTPGSYSLTAVATDNAGATTTSSAVSITVTAGSPSGLPAGWSDTDIGAVTGAGSASFTTPTFSVTGQGADIWSNADAFHYAYRRLTGDGTIIARVVTVQFADRWSKAGVMIRETLDAGSTHAFMLVSAGKGAAFQRRDATNDISVNTAGSLSAPPRWVKLTRSGNAFSAYESADGTTWTLDGTDTIPMAATVYVGLAVTSHTTAASCTATFDGVTVQ